MTLPTDPMARGEFPMADGLKERTCPRCNEIKSIAGFHASNRRAGVRIGDGSYVQSSCKTCQADDKKRTRARNRKFLDSKKLESGCVDCGYRDHAFALDFHHVGEKKFSFGSRYALQATLSALSAEIDSCVVVCAICHRKRHYVEDVQ